MPAFHSKNLTRTDELIIVAWLEANGCRDYVSDQNPVILRGNVVEYTAVCRRDQKSVERIPFIGDDFILAGRRRLRINVPLAVVRRRFFAARNAAIREHLNRRFSDPPADAQGSTARS